jgi:hypothetical protein
MVYYLLVILTLQSKITKYNLQISLKMNLTEALQIASVISDAQERISDYNSLQHFRNNDVEQVINK